MMSSTNNITINQYINELVQLDDIIYQQYHNQSIHQWTSPAGWYHLLTISQSINTSIPVSYPTLQTWRNSNFFSKRYNTHNDVFLIHELIIHTISKWFLFKKIIFLWFWNFAVEPCRAGGYIKFEIHILPPPPSWFIYFPQIKFDVTRGCAPQAKSF